MTSIPCKDCKHKIVKGREILEQCPTHHAEWQALHDQAQRDYRASGAGFQSKPQGVENGS